MPSEELDDDYVQYAESLRIASELCSLLMTSMSSLGLL